jgi:penicillin-binding protein 1C
VVGAPTKRSGRPVSPSAPRRSLVADFACFTHRLIIEVDGSMHEGEEAVERDARRDARLDQRGWRVLRYTNLEIFDNLDFVLEEIGQALRWQERLNGRADRRLIVADRASRGGPLSRAARDSSPKGEQPALPIWGRRRRTQRDRGAAPRTQCYAPPMRLLARVPRDLRRFGAGALAVVAALVALDLAFPPPLEHAVSQVALDRDGRTLRAFPLADGRWRLAADVERLDPQFLAALIAMEDERFVWHAGVDPAAAVRAAADSARAGRIVSGASTITMQTARLLEPRPRTFSSKAIEMLRAAQLERRLSKDQILALYLTLAPYGGPLEGVRAASWAYFGREPERLAPEEIALLIALPQSPEARRPDRRPEAAITARNRVLDRMAAAGLIAPERAAEAKAAPAPPRRDFPVAAWHAAEEARERAGPDAAAIVTTLDGGLQAELETLARATAERAGPAVQVSILVVETETRAVRAAVGSAGRDRPGGWLDLTDRRRSPGSTLKPLIYAFAFEDGRAAPETRIEDLPRRFAGYRPENFDRTFRGEVTVAEALQHSLNVPAVHALEAVGADRFAAALSFAGASPRWRRSGETGPGLALALGGAGLTARDLAVLYAALADGGRAAPLAWLESEAVPVDDARGHRLLSPQAAGDVLAILRWAPAPEGRAPAALTTEAPEIAFKTGTSYGFRDAWAAGVGGGHVAVVWLGRADGAPRPGDTGRSEALPLLFDVFDRVAVRSRGAAPARAAPARVATPRPLREFERGGAPVILFPPERAELWADRFGADARAFVLAGRGQGRLDWYVDGSPTPRDAAGDPIWRPAAPGFYAVTAVDGAGRSSEVRVRVIGPAGD